MSEHTETTEQAEATEHWPVEERANGRVKIVRGFWQTLHVVVDPPLSADDVIVTEKTEEHCSVRRDGRRRLVPASVDRRFIAELNPAITEALKDVVRGKWGNDRLVDSHVETVEFTFRGCRTDDQREAKIQQAREQVASLDAAEGAKKAVLGLLDYVNQSLDAHRAKFVDSHKRLFTSELSVDFFESEVPEWAMLQAGLDRLYDARKAIDGLLTKELELQRDAKIAAVRKFLWESEAVRSRWPEGALDEVLAELATNGFQVRRSPL